MEDHDNNSIALSVIPEEYDYTPTLDATRGDYDYESAYEEPSDEKAKLLELFKKLAIRSIPKEELE